MKSQTACFTGHRILDKTFTKKRLKNEIEKLIEKGVIFWGNGGSIGFDTISALTILELKEKHPQIKLIMVLPCRDQDKLWSKQDKEAYDYILENADKVVYTSERYYNGCMHVRNRHLVDNSSCCIAYLNKNTGGSAASPMAAPKPVKGMIVSTAMPVNVSRVTEADARLCMKGILGVRIRCMTRVWLHMDSTNHPAWKMAI